MKEIRIATRSQIRTHARNFLTDCEDEINDLTQSSDPVKIHEVLLDMLVNFDEYLEG